MDFFSILELFLLQLHLHGALTHVLLGRDKKKESAPNCAAYYPFGADIFLSPRKINHIVRFVEFPHIYPPGEIPSILVVNIQVYPLFSFFFSLNVAPILHVFIARGKMLQTLMVVVVQPYCMCHTLDDILFVESVGRVINVGEMEYIFFDIC